MNENVNVITPEGELANLPQEHLPEAIKYGYRPATSDEVKHQLLKEQYGQGFGNELLTGIEGAASGATFGISRHLENATGLTTPEAQAARKEFNPASAMTGEIAGIGGSLLLAPEASLPGLVAKGSRLTESVAAKILGESALSKIASRTVAQGLEAMTYGASAPISEKALGDPTLTAQKVFNQIGIAGLIGGGLGAVTSALGIGLGKLLVRPIQEAAEEVPRGTSGLGEGPIPPFTKPEYGGPRFYASPEGTMVDVDSAAFKAKQAAKEAANEVPLDFGKSDEQILKDVEKVNPRNPLNKHDLNWLKNPLNAEPDAAGKPQIFDKIGTKEIPTMDPMAEGKVQMSDSVAQGMKNLKAEQIKINNDADRALEQAIMPNKEPLSMTRNQYLKVFNDEADAIKGTTAFGKPTGKKAVKALESWIEAGADMPDVIPATEIRNTLQDIRDEVFSHVKGGGVKDDAVSKALYKAQDTLNQYLKDNSPEYKAIQEKFAPFTRNSIDLEDSLGWNYQKGASDYEMDWVKNRIAKPFQSSLPGNKDKADLLRWFSKYAGFDIEKAAKTNLIYSKLNPEAYNAATWGAQMAEGIGALSHPTAIPGGILKGATKFALTEELPDFIQNIKTKGTIDTLLGKSSASSGAVNSILSTLKSAGNAGSKLFNQDSPFGSMLVPAGVKLQQYIAGHNTVEDANSQLDTLLALEKAQNKADKAIDGAVDGIFTDKKSATNTDMGDFLGKSSKEHADDLEKLAADANQLVNNPELLMQKLSQSLAGIGKHAPNVAVGLNMTATRAVSMLAQKLNGILPQGQKMALDQKYVPSKTQLMSIAKTLKYINSPYDVLKEIQNGRVSNEGKEVLQKIYPELLQEMKGKILNGISIAQSKGKVIPNSKRLGLSFFLGQQLDSTLTPQAMQANQMAFMMPMTTQNAPNPRPSSAKHLGLSMRALTPLQKVAGRQ